MPMLADRLVSTDPDVVAPGMAFFVDTVLLKAFALPLERAIKCLADECAFIPFLKQSVGFVIEMPQQYGRVGDQRDFLAVARVVGRFEQVAIQNGAEVRVIEPRAWKGQVPKRVMSVRVWQALSADERLAVDISLQARKKLNSGAGVESGEASDALDAVGIGLWALGRLAEKRRV